MLSSKTLRWGILGTSFISDVMVQAIQKEGRSTVTAVTGRNQERLNAFAEKHQIPTTATDYHAIINHPDVDIVYIALPNHLHHEYAAAAAQAGKAILCEKSLSVTTEQAACIAKHVKEHNVFFAEGLMYRHHPVISSLLELLKTGEIGTVQSIQSSYIAAIDQFVNPDSMGAIFNLGCYPASLAYLVMQNAHPEQASDQYQAQAFGRRGADGNICDTSLNMLFGNGCQVQLHTAEDYGLKHHFRILGKKGFIEMTSNPWLPEEENQISWGIYEQEVHSVAVSAEGDAFLYQVRNIVDALQNGEKAMPAPAASLDDSVEIMEWLERWHDLAQATALAA